jgi:hypothetical protein
MKSLAGIAASPGRLLVSTSCDGGTVPGISVAGSADLLLLHSNGVADPQRVHQMVQRTRALATYHDPPILFNEDDHRDFDKHDNDFMAAIGDYTSLGLFDYRMRNEWFHEGHQSVPANWSPDISARIIGLFGLVAEMTNSNRWQSAVEVPCIGWGACCPRPGATASPLPVIPGSGKDVSIV